jgi:hypothetical protein
MLGKNVQNPWSYQRTTDCRCARQGYAIEISTNLTQWSNVFISNSPALPFNWTDAATNSPLRFYRVKLGPPLP